MPKVFDDFLGQVLSQIRCKQAHESVRQELSSHLNDQTEAYESHGKDPETARREAVRQMGDPVIIGGQLDAVHRPRPDWFVLVLALALMAGGAVLQILLSIAGQFDVGSSLVLGICFGVAALLIPYFLDYTIIAKRQYILYIAVCAVCLLPYLFFGNSLLILTHPLFWLGGLGAPNHYVSYTAFLFVPVLCGLIYSQKNRGKTGMISCILFMLPPAFICVLSGNYSTLSIVYASFFILLIAAAAKNWFGGKKAHSFLLLIVPVAVFFAAIALSGRFEFIPAAFDTVGNMKIDGINYLLSHAQWLSQSTGWKTLFPYENNMYIAFWDSNYWLVSIIAQFGWVPGLGILAGITLLLWRLFATAFRQKNALAYFVCLAVSLLITFQCLTFILMNFGISVDGANGLPLVFNRASGMAVNMFLLGLYLSACKFGKTASAKVTLGRSIEA